MRNLHNSSFDPPTLVVLEAAFDEAWLTLKSIGNTTVKPDELARSVLRLATEGERRDAPARQRSALSPTRNAEAATTAADSHPSGFDRRRTRRPCGLFQVLSAGAAMRYVAGSNSGTINEKRQTPLARL